MRKGTSLFSSPDSCYSSGPPNALRQPDLITFPGEIISETQVLVSPSPRRFGDSRHSPQLLLYLKKCPHRTSNVSENYSRKHTEKEKFNEERQEVVKYKEENRNKEDNTEFPSATSPPTHTPFFKISKLKTFLITKKNTFKKENKMYFS